MSHEDLVMGENRCPQGIRSAGKHIHWVGHTTIKTATGAQIIVNIDT